MARRIFDLPILMPQPFVVYRSSAGSGKTYTLTKEYIKLAFQEPDYFKHILAVTFTNKATKEMKSRVLSVLSSLAKGPHPLASELKKATGLDDDELRQRSRDILASILHNYSYFSISTIDSFFQKVIRAFAREMGLQGGFRIELDEDLVLAEVIDKVLLEVGQNENLTKWLIKFAETRVDDGKPWDTRREIGNLAKEIFQENFKQFEPEILAVAKDNQFIPGFLSALNEVKRSFEDTLKKLGKQGMEIIARHKLDVTDFAYKESGPAGYIEKLSQGKITAPGIRIESAALDTSAWYAKTNPLRANIRNCVEDGLQEILQQVVVHYKKDQVPYESANEVLRYLYTYGILADLASKLEEYRDENELMLISDAAVFLKKIIADTDSPFIYEKVGTRYRHYLMDEFQDTSGFQWDNFRPLVDNSLAEGNYNLVVGDVKQSIYRWRGGDLDLLLEGIQRDIGIDRITYEDLTQNWRSRGNIVDFNNSLFQFAREALNNQVNTKLEEVEDEHVKTELAEKADKIKTAYQEVIQTTARESSDDKGFLRFRFYPYTGTNGAEWKDNVLYHLPAMLNELQDQKYSLKDIAILVRTRAEGQAIVDYLLQYQSSQTDTGYKYDVISSESLYLEHASLSRFLIACLKYIYKPDDAIQRVHMAYEYLQYINPIDKELDKLFRDSSNLDREKEFREQFTTSFFERIPELRKCSVYQLVEELVRIFELDRFHTERAYLQGFLDAVLDFTKTENDDILSFLSWWELMGRERTIMVSEDQEAIRVMTIHMAKGLQFKAVLIPFCEWNMDGLQGFDNILWSKSETEPFNQAPYLPLNYSTKLKSTVFFKNFYEELIKSYLDNLNILYVAFTRAEEVLMASMPQHRRAGDIRVSSAILDQYFVSEYKLDQFIGDHNEEYIEMTLGKYPDLGVEEVSKDELRSIHLAHFPSYNWMERLTIRREFEDYDMPGEAQADPSTILNILRSLDSIDRIDRIINQKLTEGLAHQSEKPAIQKEMSAILSMDEVNTWFRPSDNFATSVSLLIPGSDDISIDRIVYADEKTKIIQFVVSIDDEIIPPMKRALEHFKSGGKPAIAFVLDVASRQLVEVK